MPSLLALVRQIKDQEEFDEKLEELIQMIADEHGLTDAQKRFLPSTMRNHRNPFRVRLEHLVNILRPPGFEELRNWLPEQLEISSLAGERIYRVENRPGQQLIVYNSNDRPFTINLNDWVIAVQVRDQNPLDPWLTRYYSQHNQLFPSLIHAAALLRHFEEGSEDERSPAARNAARQNGIQEEQAECAEDVDDTTGGVFDDPSLAWQENQVSWRSRILIDFLKEKVPDECLCLRLIACGQLLGKISRADAAAEWGRIMGQRLAQDLSFSIPSSWMEDSEITVVLTDEASGTHLSESLPLWDTEEEITRFDHNGKRQADAWGRPLPVGQLFSLCVPEDAQIDGPKHRESVLQAAGVKVVHFQQGWTNPIRVTLGGEQLLWDSENLVSSANQVPENLRDFNTLLVIDHVGADFVTAHLEIHGVDPIRVMVQDDNRPFEMLSVAGALRFGYGQRDLADLWKSLRVRIKLTGEDGATHWLARSTKLVTRNLTHPLFLGKDAEGKVVMLGYASAPQTAADFHHLGIRAVCDHNFNGSIHLLQGERPMYVVPKAHEKRAGVRPTSFAARGLPITYATYGPEGQPGSNGRLMPGVVERGVIRKVGNFDEQGFRIELNHAFEPTQSISPEGKHHRVLVLSQTIGEPGARLLMQKVCGKGSFEAENGDWSVWRVNVKEKYGNVLGVALCYGNQILGCWTKGGQNACQTILQAKDLTSDEVRLFADFARWFHLPFLDPTIKPAMLTFVRNHAAAVLSRWASSDSFDAIESDPLRGIPEPHWTWMVRYLFMEANWGLNGGLSFSGLEQQVAQGDPTDHKNIVRLFAELAPKSVQFLTNEEKELLGAADVTNDHQAIRDFDERFRSFVNEKPRADKIQWQAEYRKDPDKCRSKFRGIPSPDPDWAELRHELAKMERAMETNIAWVDLWLNASYRVNAALNDGVTQCVGGQLDLNRLNQLRYLMPFPAFARLLARKILHPQLTIPDP